MNRCIKGGLIISVATLFAACATPLPTGALYTDIKTGVYDNNGEGGKIGKACSISYFGLVATGDASIDAAKKAGGLDKVASVTYEANNVLGIYGKYCAVVKGN